MPTTRIFHEKDLDFEYIIEIFTKLLNKRGMEGCGFIKGEIFFLGKISLRQNEIGVFVVEHEEDGQKSFLNDLVFWFYETTFGDPRKKSHS